MHSFGFQWKEKKSKAKEEIKKKEVHLYAAFCNTHRDFGVVSQYNAAEQCMGIEEILLLFSDL